MDCYAKGLTADLSTAVVSKPTLKPAVKAPALKVQSGATKAIIEK